MKNLNLSYILFGVFIIKVITRIKCGKPHTEVHVMPEEVLSFPNPEEVKEEVETKIEEVKEDIKVEVEEVKEVIEEKVEELKELLPSIDCYIWL